MKSVFALLKTFWKKDYHPTIYGLSLAFIASAIVLNYHFDYEDGILDSYRTAWYAWDLYFLNYALPYFFVILLYYIFRRSIEFEIKQEFWVYSLFAIALLSLKVWFHWHEQFLPTSDYQSRYLYFKISKRVVNVGIYALGILGFYFIYEKLNKSLYGLLTPEFNWRPYVFMLMIMVPLIGWASFQADFLESYPRLSMRAVKENYFAWLAIFEPLYLAEFITLEWFFRGFLVVGMLQILGHRAVLPMAMLYCVFHFGKPMGECIGSLFGGYILGAIAWSTRSVWGGIIVHMGVAFLMDAFALGSHIFIYPK